jgi:hypothetical protein
MPTFRFVEFNPRRVARGAEGARVEVTYDDGTSDLLWMTKRDIAKNMMAFGRCPELTKAHEAYSSAGGARSRP